MPISAQEVVLSDYWDRKQRRIVACGTRWEENDLAKMQHQGENEKEYSIVQRRKGAGVQEACMQRTKYAELEVEK